MRHFLFSAPDEEYKEHIELCLEKLKILLPLFLIRLKSVLSYDNEEAIHDAFVKMLRFHDLGKLTKKWQENLGSNRPLPPHSSVGACYLWNYLPKGLKEPISFAVLIHHTDKGLLGDNIERPDVQAINNGIIDLNGNIIWHEEVNNLENDIFPEGAKNLKITDLKQMAKNLRVWARGNSFLKQHKRRLQAVLCHHILKLCDISAAVERKEYLKKGDIDYFGGWLMVEEIKRYMDNIQQRGI